MKVAVLFARKDSIYKTIPECDVYDIDRDARNFVGGLPVIAHPPCRAWGRLRHFARPRADEKDLALFAVNKVRECGGVLEHPGASTLWLAAELPKFGTRDRFGGFSLGLNQHWFGHRAEKATWLYICGIEPTAIPIFSLIMREPTHVVSSTRGKFKKPECTKAERERTPVDFAKWLVELAQTTTRNKVREAAIAGE